jgi:uncharacterized cupin superfamily protein
MVTESQRIVYLSHRDKSVEHHRHGRNDEMKFVHLCTGADGESHFRDVEVEMKGAGNRGQRSELMKATGIFFSVTGADYDLDWHNAPRRQFVITLEGEVEITASDGMKRRFGPGDIMLADDMTGRGHISRAVNNRPRKAIFVTLD